MSGEVFFDLVNHIETQRQQLHIFDALDIEGTPRQHAFVSDAFQIGLFQLVYSSASKEQDVVDDRVFEATVLQYLGLCCVLGQIGTEFFCLRNT